MYRIRHDFKPECLLHLGQYFIDQRAIVDVHLNITGITARVTRTFDASKFLKEHKQMCSACGKGKSDNSITTIKRLQPKRDYNRVNDLKVSICQ